MSATIKSNLKRVMTLAWQFVKKNGYTMSKALKVAWCNVKLHAKMQGGIVKFYFQKVDGSIREAFGTLATNLIPSTGDGRKPNVTVQPYFDTEKGENGEWRCFKVANLISFE